MTQHIFNVAFDFDDERIREFIEKDAVDAVKKDAVDLVAAKIENALPHKYAYLGEDKVDWKNAAYGAIDRFMDRHSRDIIDIAALALVQRVSRKTTWKKAIEAAHAELDGEGAEDGAME